MLAVILLLVIILGGVFVVVGLQSAAQFETARAAKQIADVAEIQATTALVDKSANFLVLLLALALIIGGALIVYKMLRSRQEGRREAKSAKRSYDMARGENAPVSLAAGSSIERLTELMTMQMLMDMQERMERKRTPARREPAYLDEYIDIDN